MQPLQPTCVAVVGIQPECHPAPTRPKNDSGGVPRLAFALLLCVLASGASSGCSLLQPRGDPTRFYVLTTRSARPDAAANVRFKRWKVGLGTVELPGYLRTKAMVVRTSANEIYFADFDRWAEPLDQGIGRVVRETLSAARNVAIVTLNSHGGASLDYEVAIRISACEGVRFEAAKSSVSFAATWEVRSVGTNLPALVRGGFTSVPTGWDGNDFGQLAGRLSDAIAGAGRALAADLPLEPEFPRKTNSEQTKP